MWGLGIRFEKGVGCWLGRGGSEDAQANARVHCEEDVGCWVLAFGLIAVVVRTLRLMVVSIEKECTKIKDSVAAVGCWVLGVGLVAVVVRMLRLMVRRPRSPR